MRELLNEIINFMEVFLKKEDGTLTFLGKGMKILLIIIVVKISIKLIHSVIDRAFHQEEDDILSASQRKENTLVTVFKNIIKYTIYFIGLMMILEIFGVNTNSILATAGVGGLAIGFAAQSLVKDLITGFFILLENQFSVGDYIQVDQYDGIVEELGVRVTKLRAFSGELHIMPNSTIQVVTNKTRGAMRALVTISVDYGEDLDKVIRVLDKVCEEARKENKNIVEGPIVQGINDLGAYGVDINIMAKTIPMEQWNVERELRKTIKEALDREGIEIPYPKHVVYNKEN